MPVTLDPESGDLIGRDLIHEQELGRFLRRLKDAMRSPENKHVIWELKERHSRRLFSRIS